MKLIIETRQAKKVRRVLKASFGSAVRIYKAHKGPGRHLPNGKSLREVMAKLLKKHGPKRAARLATMALKAGWKTTSRDLQVFKANAANILRISKEFQKGMDGRYSLR